MLAVASGLCRHVLCFRTVWEATAAARQRDSAAQGRLLPELKNPLMAWQAPFGASSAATIIAMYASNYFHHFGADRQALGWIALTARAGAARNPEAIYRDPLTMDDYLSARMISSPFGLYDCDVPCDGAIAVVVSAAQTRAGLRAPVRVEAVGTQILDRISWDQDTITHEPQVIGPAAHLWTRTDLKPADVDVALLYDGFTFNCLSWLEALGFCEFGEGPDFVAGGRRIGLGGELPLNTHGGQLSAGRTHGYGFVLEAVRQLRGEAAGRQVDGAEVAVVSTGGGTPGGCLLLTR
jgi:acetyl-CoA acetyltransferase